MLGLLVHRLFGLMYLITFHIIDFFLSLFCNILDFIMQSFST